MSRCADSFTKDNKKSELKILELESERMIDEKILSDEFIFNMELYREKMESIAGYLPETVIAGSNGMPIDPGYFNRIFKQALNLSGIKSANFDILRNTFAVRYLEKGHDFSELHSLLGCKESSRSLLKLKHMASTTLTYKG